MPSYTFTSPDGKSYTVNGPEGSTPEQAWGVLQQQLGMQQAPAESEGILSGLMKNASKVQASKDSIFGQPKTEQAAKPATPFEQPAVDAMGNITGMAEQPVEQPQGLAAIAPTKPSELAPGEEFGKGLGAGVIGLKSMWENAGVMKDVGALGTVEKRLDLFGQIDSGQITDFDQLRGLDLSTSQARAYLGATPEMRDKMKERLTGEVAKRTDFVKASIDTLAQYQKEMEQYKGRTVDLTDIENAKDFANWLSYNVGSGAVQMAPIMIAAATTGPGGVAVLGTGMGVSEAVGNRMDALAPKLEGLNKDEKAKAIVDYVTKTGDTALAVGVISGAFDTILGPAATLAKRGLSQVVKGETRKEALKAGVKEIPKQMGEEFITGGAQEATQIAGAVREGEVDEFLTKENAKKILNAAAAEAAGSIGGGGATTAARVYGANKAEKEKEELLKQAFEVPAGEERAAYTKPEATDLESLARSKGFLTPQGEAQTTKLLKETESTKAPVSESQDLEAMLVELEAQMEGKPAPVKAEEPVVKQELTPAPEEEQIAQLDQQLKTPTDLPKEEPKKNFYQRVDEEVAKIDSADTLVNEFARMRDRESPLTASSQADPIAVRDAFIDRLVDKDPTKALQIATDIDAKLEQYSEQSNIPVLKLSSFASSIKKRAEQKGAQKVAPVVEEAKKAEPAISQELQDAKDALSKASQGMSTARRMRRDGEITEEQFNSLQAQFDERKQRFDELMEKEVGSKSPFYKEAVEIGNRMIATGDVTAAGFGQGVISAARSGQLDEERMKFYRERAQELQQRAPEVAGKATITEQRGLPEFVATGNKKEVARYEYLKDQPDHKDVLAKASAALQTVADEANRLGFKINDINPTSPQNLQAIKRKASQLAGATSRYMLEAERIAKGHKTADQAKLDKARAGLEADIELALKPTEKPAEPAAKAKPKTALDKVAHWRRQAWDKNPLLAWIADRGLYHEKGMPGSLMSEFNAGRQIMISGYGPLFKSSGLQIDALLPMAIQDGFLPQGATEDDLYALIQKAVSGKKVEALYQEQGVEDIAAKYEEGMAKQEVGYEERAEQTDAEWYGMSEEEYVNMMAGEVAAVSDEDFAAIDEAIQDLGQTPSSNISERAAMELLGFTEEEIQNEERRAAAKTGEAAAKEETTGAEQGAPAAQAERVYLNVPFKDNARAKQKGALWDAERKLWYMVPIQSGVAQGEYNINLTSYIPDVYAVNKTKDEARAAAENMTIKTGREHRVEKVTDGVATGYGVVDADGVPLNEGTVPVKVAKAPAELELQQQTEEELKAKQAEVDRLTKENERLAKQAEAKAKADAERDEFVLTGSDRPADVAAAQGQKDIFGAMEEEAPAADAAVTKLQKVAESLLDSPRTKETVDEVEYEGKTYESRTRSYEGRLFGSELQLLRDTVGNANSVTLVNEPERVLTLQLTGKQVGQGRDMRITETVYTPKQEAATGELVTFTHRTDTEPGKGQVSGYYPGTYSYEAGTDVAIPAKGGKNEFTGSLKESEIYTLQDADALKREASEAGFEYRQASGNSEIRYLESLGYKAMRRGPEIIVFNAKDANFKKAKPEVASEVVGPAEKPPAPKLTREPVTIEGEFTEIGEEQQRTLITDQTNKLSDAQAATLEKFYGFARDTEEFANAVRQDVVNFITKGATYVNGKIRAIIRAISNGVLSVAVVFNPQFVSQPYTIAIPQYETKIEQVMASVPEAAQKDMSDAAKRAYAVIYPSIKGEITKNDKFFIVADKQTANTFVFNPDGSLFMYSKTLFSAGIGDFLKGDNNVVANRITPAGLFNLGLRDAKRSVDEAATAGEYDFGKVFVLDKSQMGKSGPYSTTIMHSVWTKEKDAKQRLAALQKPGAEDSRYSFGCINVDKNTYGQLVTNNLAQMDGAKIFIVPEAGTDVMSFVNGEATYSKDIIRQRAEPVTKEVKQEVQRAAPAAETERTIAAKEEEGPIYNSIEPTSNAFTRWTRGLPVIRMGEDHVFKSGEGVVVQSIHATTGDFDTFDRRKGNIESDLGAGFYSTNSTTDAAANYAGMGPDLTQKVERLVKQISDAAQDGDEDTLQSIRDVLGIDDDQQVFEDEIEQGAKELARRKFMANEGLSMPVFVRFENPVVLGGKGETFLDYNQEYNKKTDEYGEPSGTLVDLAMAIREIGEDGSFEMDTEKAVDALMQEMDGMKASDAIASLKSALIYAVDYDTGDVATNEIIRQAFERVGFDGFIDTTVNKKFGSEKRVGKSMAGMTPDTVHFIAFQPNQIKSSIGNRGTYDESGVITNDLSIKPIAAEEKKRSPSFKRRMDKLNRDRISGKISDERFINEADWALKSAENDRLSKEPAEKQRGYLELVKRLSEAAKRGEISLESFEMATWFMRNNPALVEDLGVRILGRGKEGVGGQYSTFSRVMILIKGAGSNLTVVHEILHHLERMMPAEVQQAIRTAWAKQLAKAMKNAKTPAEKVYFKALMNAHYGNDNLDYIDVPNGPESVIYTKALENMLYGAPGSKSSMTMAETLLKMGLVSMDNYQYFNPSEFWAVNGSEIVQGRFDAVQGGVLSRLKNWLKELAQKIKSLVGMNSNASIIKALDSLSKSDGKFVTKDMLGEGEYKSVRRNIQGDEAPAASWESPEESKMDNFIYKLQDKLIDTKRVIQSIKKASGDIADNWNVYLKEELYHGRTAKRTQDFLNREMLPILEEMKDSGVNLDQFEEYLHMRHAEERNAQIAKINPKMNASSEETSGSGVSNDRAAKYLASLSDDERKKFESLAKKFDKIISNTQKILVDGGLEKQETIDAWNQAYEHYVPLMRDDLDFKHHGKGLGAGYSTRGSSTKSAFGSTKKVIDIFATVALQRERAIVRSEKARVGRALYGLAIKNPNPGFWLPINPDAIKNKDKLIEELQTLGLSPEDASNIIQEPSVPVVDKKTGLVKYQVNPLLRNSDNVFPVRINGEDRYIFFNTSDDRAIRMVEALKNLDAEQMGAFLGSIGTVTRWIASVNTQYNPVFGLWNFARDVQGAAFNLTTTEIAGYEKEVLDGVLPALKGIYTDLRQNRKKKTGDSEWAKLFEQYELAGGQTGYRDQFNQTERRANIVKRELERLNHGNVRKAAEAVFNWLSDYNDAMENAVRLSAFKVALDQGLSEERAASIAKNLTVNFNRKGASSPILQTLYAFFNAAVQGSTRLIETLRGPAGKKIMAGGMAIGVAQAIALAIAGFDDDDPPEFLKNKNLIIPTPGGTYLIVPLPLGFNIFPGIGRLTTEYVLGQAGLITGAKGAGDKLVSVAALILDAFNPLGAGSVLQMATPTIGDPLMSVFGTNRDAFGRPISKEDRATAPTPGYTRSRENASWFSKQLAEFLNYVSSPVGTKYTKGFISPTADQIDYLIGQYTGGVGREVVKAAQYVSALISGETGDLPSYRVPIVGKLYGETESPAAISAKFYENVVKLAEHENEIKMRIKNKDDIREYRAEHPETRFISRVNNIENQIAAINKQKKALQERDAPPEKIKRLEDRKTEMMHRFNQQIKNLERQL